MSRRSRGQMLLQQQQKKAKQSTQLAGNPESESSLPLEGSASRDGEKILSPLKKLQSPSRDENKRTSFRASPSSSSKTKKVIGKQDSSAVQPSLDPSRFDIEISRLIRQFKTLESALHSFQSRRRVCEWSLLVEAFQRLVPQALTLNDLLKILNIMPTAYSVRWHQTDESNPNKCDLIIELPSLSAITADSVNAYNAASTLLPSSSRMDTFSDLLERKVAAALASNALELGIHADPSALPAKPHTCTAPTTTTTTTTTSTSTSTSTVSSTDSSGRCDSSSSSSNVTGSGTGSTGAVGEQEAGRIAAVDAVDDARDVPLAKRMRSSHSSSTGNEGRAHIQEWAVHALGRSSGNESIAGGSSRTSGGSSSSSSSSNDNSNDNSNNNSNNNNVSRTKTATAAEGGGGGSATAMSSDAGDNHNIGADNRNNKNTNDNDTLEVLRARAVERGRQAGIARAQLSIRLAHEAEMKLLSILPAVADALRSNAVRQNRAKMPKRDAQKQLANLLCLSTGDIGKAFDLISQAVPDFFSINIANGISSAENAATARAGGARPSAGTGASAGAGTGNDATVAAECIVVDALDVTGEASQTITTAQNTCTTVLATGATDSAGGDVTGMMAGAAAATASEVATARALPTTVRVNTAIPYREVRGRLVEYVQAQQQLLQSKDA